MHSIVVRVARSVLPSHFNACIIMTDALVVGNMSTAWSWKEELLGVYTFPLLSPFPISLQWMSKWRIFAHRSLERAAAIEKNFEPQRHWNYTFFSHLSYSRWSAKILFTVCQAAGSLRERWMAVFVTGHHFSAAGLLSSQWFGYYLFEHFWPVCSQSNEVLNWSLN